MEDITRLDYLKTILGITDNTQDAELTVYLALAEKEVIGYKYSVVGVSQEATVPPEDEVTLIMACAAGFGHKGAPDETMHDENGINRSWVHSDMVDYIHSFVLPYARLI